MEKERLIAILKIAIGFFYVALSITIFGLDMAAMSKTNYAGSIAMIYFNSSISYGSIYIGVMVMGIFGCLLVFFSVFIAISKDAYFFSLLTSSGALVFLGIPKEGISYKFMVCFNYTYYQIVQARACLTFILVILVISFHLFLLLSKEDLPQKWYKFAKISIFAISILVLIGIAILNIFLLANINTSFTKDISPSKIKIGFFNQTEIDQIDQNKFAKDASYSLRFVGNLNDILESQNKRLAYSQCSRSNCRRYYWRFLHAEIKCNSATQKFYPDCSNALYLLVKLMYLDSGPYPTYNCATVTKNMTCFSSCPSLSDYKLYLVQEFNDQVELAWNGFSNCEVKKPNIQLIRQSQWNICEENHSSRNNFNNFLLFFFIFFQLKIFSNDFTVL